MKIFTLTVACLIALCFDLRSTAQPAAGCRENSSAAAPAPFRWLPDSDVHVIFTPGHFSKSEIAALAPGLRGWQRELAQPHIRINLINEGERIPLPNEMAIVIGRKDSLPAGRQAQFIAVAGSGGYFTAGEVAINKGIKKSAQLAELLQHELGHAFGLMDCPSCKSGSTIMRLQDVVINGLSIARLLQRREPGLTPCDQHSLLTGYQNHIEPDLQITLGAVIGVDDVDDIVTKKDFDTTAPEVGDGRQLIDNVQPRPEPAAAEKVLVAAVIASEVANARALNSYAFKREVLIETVDAAGVATGSYYRLSQFVFDDSGMRIEKIISLPKPTLKHLIITNEDLKDLAGVQLLGWETTKADLYRLTADGRDAENRQLRFRVLPVDLLQAKRDGARVLYGTLWVDESTMKILKVRGRALPEGNQRFPVFETERTQITAGIWAPAVTFADEVLNFPNRSVRMRVRVRYFDYREFRSKLTITEVDPP